MKTQHKILMIDDDPDFVDGIRVILENAGYDVETFADPEQAFLTFKKTPDAFDLVITDLTMPHMQGTELAEKILDITPQIPIILSTGFIEKNQKRIIYEIGVKKTLSKPMTQEKLLETVSSTLNEIYPENNKKTC